MGDFFTTTLGILVTMGTVLALVVGIDTLSEKVDLLKKVKITWQII